MQAAWALLLARYLDDDRPRWGVITSGRSPELAGVESMVGLFNNLLPFQTRIDPAAPVVDWMRDLQLRLTEMREHEHSAPADIRRWIGAAGESPLFDSYIVYENFPIPVTVQDQMRSWGGAFRRFWTQTEHPLRVMLIPQHDRFLVSFQSYRRWFSAGDIDEMLADYRRMLAALAGPSDSRDARDTLLRHVHARADVRALRKPAVRP